jgi:hypothetical protein
MDLSAEVECLCGSANGEAITDERLEEGLNTGALFNFDPND